MSKTPHYVINVSKNSRHLFATNPTSLWTWSDVVRVMEVFVEKFPDAEGYKISVTYWDIKGMKIDYNQSKKKWR